MLTSVNEHCPAGTEQGSLMDFRTTGVTGLARAIRAKETSALEAVEHALGRIEELNPTFNAFTRVDAEGARAQARELDRRIAAGEDVGPLAGVPIGVKDLEDAAGFTTSCGSAAYADAPAAERDSVHVARLRAAGCVVVGKTNAPEFGLRGETDNPTFGITRNPWNAAHTPGGSSGGSSAAVSAGMVPLATASDGGGSIRIPAAATALTGLKPTQGVVPAADRTPVGWGELSTRGPMARRAVDVAAALDAVVGPDPRDLRSVPVTESFVAAASQPTRPTRVAWSPTLGYATVDSEVARICESAVRQMEKDGVEVVEAPTVFSSDPGQALGVLVSTYTRRTIEPFRGTPVWDRLDPLVFVAAELSRATVRDPLGVVEAEDACHRTNLELQDVLDDVDLLICPATMALPPVAENSVGIEGAAALLAGAFPDDVIGELGLEDPAGFLEELRRREPFNIPMGTIDGQPVGVWHGMTQAFNMTRSPVGTVCAGFSESGLPVGIQVVGRRLDDVRIVSVLAYLEALLALDTVAPGG
jgi:aspartyl-tRNA(Asn)/glutamyl-tRNA(Gln) amidotransferase subunit A